MNKIKFIKTKDVGKIIKDGDMIFVSGFVGTGSPEEILIGLEKSFLETGSPKNLGLFFAAGFGDGKTKGLNRFSHKGMVKKVIGGHWGLAPELGKLAINNEIIAYNLPQGVISQMFRDIASKKLGTISHVGLGTFVDPDLQGGKLNNITTEDIVEKIKIKDKETLLYFLPTPDIGIFKGSYADMEGNISMSEEPLTLDVLNLAMAVKNAGGKVIVQVKKIFENRVFQPYDVKVPSILIDYILIAEDKENSKQNFSEYFNENYVSRNLEESETKNTIQELNERKIIARRSAMELNKDMRILNYGIGVPEVIPSILKEEGVEENFIPTVEPGVIGGTPASGLAFGASSNPKCIIDQSNQFAFYDGSGLDIAFLGLAQCDEKGNINVSKFGTKIAGAGGFINITQNTKEVVFCGTFTANGLKIKIENERLIIVEEGKNKKFIKNVEQITFSGNIANQNNKKVKYITERAVFELSKEGVILTEIAPGIDLEKDILNNMEFKPLISKELKKMDLRLFLNKKMGLVI